MLAANPLFRWLRLLAILALCVGCASREAFGTSSLSILGPGVVNDPANRSLRFDLLKFGLDRFCSEMTARGLALKMSDDEPVMGRFYANACNSQVIDEDARKSFVLQYGGVGFAASPEGGRIGFSTNGLVEYAPDFLMKNGALYIYFRPRVVDAAGFQTLLIESQLAATALKLFGVDADGFGRKVVDAELRRGFTVVRYGDSGETDFGLGVIALGDKPYHPFSVSSETKKVLVNERTEVHLGQQDFIGPLEVAANDQALYLDVTLDGAPAVDAIVISESVGRVLIDTYTKHAGAVSLPPGAALLDEPVLRAQTWKRFVALPKGRYYVVIDNSAAIGPTTPPLGPVDGLSARTDVLALVGERP